MGISPTHPKVTHPMVQIRGLLTGTLTEFELLKGVSLMTSDDEGVGH